MENKIYDLLEKVYIEVQDTKKELQDTRKDLQETKVEVKENRKDIIRLENEMSNKISILFDGQKATNDRLDRIEKKLDDLSEKVDKHDIKIQVIEGGKKKKTI